MAGPRSNEKDASIRDLLTKTQGKKTDRIEEASQPEQLIALGTAVSPNDAEPVTCTLLGALFGALHSDIPTLKQDLMKDTKGLTKDIYELWDRVDTLE
ncbi:hypothetical protein NDU88_000735 [Pleurodeles waltl]|uniref:Uncharacterized protein n=1 Tax=Pleurodeles waltl TaxID=8319 RepID=A0AAV7LFL0_PLEWA|nr:hypothetical protein NDU88_000735 [Pleurodeles waltl]